MLKRLLKISGLGICLVLFGMSIYPLFSHNKEMTSTSRPYEKSEYTYIVDNQTPLGDEISFSSLDLEIVNVINDERGKVNLEPYGIDQALGEAAYIRAEECEQVFSHTRPDGSGWYTVNQNVCFGENLAFGYDNAEEVVEAWLDSPTHRDLIYDSEYETCGIGHHVGFDGTTYIACEFGY